MNATTPSPERRRFLGRLFFGMFVLALIMGPGPGIYLINPDPADPDAQRFLFGAPIVYVWAACWFFVQAASVVLAYLFVWNSSSKSNVNTDA